MSQGGIFRTWLGTVVSIDAHLANGAAIRHQVGIVDQKPVEFAKRQPTRRGHVEDLALIVDQRRFGIELDRKRLFIATLLRFSMIPSAGHADCLPL
jgi:hypothetical protein